MKKLVVLTGAGISAESGIKTFRDSDGLWENYPVNQVASIEGWGQNPQLMLQFYNDRRDQLKTAQPNAAHRILAQMESRFDVRIVTQNIDDLHERAGSSQVLHLHGELTKARSQVNEHLITDIGYRHIQWGEKAADGSQLRPHVVWFGEAVPNMDLACKWTEQADILLIVGTSMVVYPAAGLIHYAPKGIPVFLIDPRPASIQRNNLTVIAKKASIGMAELEKMI